MRNILLNKLKFKLSQIIGEYVLKKCKITNKKFIKFYKTNKNLDKNLFYKNKKSLLVYCGEEFGSKNPIKS